MSNTVKIKNRKKKNDVKVNYKLWAGVFGAFVAAIVILAVWASFHWGVGMGTIGVRPVTPENADAGATESAAEYSTDGAVVLTPEQLEEMGISLDDLQEVEAEGSESAGDAAADAAAGGEAAADGEASGNDAAAETQAPAEGGAEDGAAAE